jgi:GGDEF domain-containing protein
MSRPAVLVYYSHGSGPIPPLVEEFAGGTPHPLIRLRSLDEVVACVGRAYPAAIIVDGTLPADRSLDVVRWLKGEPFTAVVPVIIDLNGTGEAVVSAALETGADEVLTPALSHRERLLRLGMALRRAERDVSVHPTTRLPGTVQIERDFLERLRSGEKFAVCYADLDHFKEFNDRYGYNHGDRVILILSRILRDVVRAHCPGGFVGHIGGDDFIFNVALDRMRLCCDDIIDIFSELIPLQYTEEDCQRGYFVGYDRRGGVYQVPLMTLSIGVVTNEHRAFSHTAQISELASEMKTYAKTLPGSVYAVDRRTKSRLPESQEL